MELFSYEMSNRQRLIIMAALKQFKIKNMSDDELLVLFHVGLDPVCEASAEDEALAIHGCMADSEPGRLEMLVI